MQNDAVDLSLSGDFTCTDKDSRGRFKSNRVCFRAKKNKVSAESVEPS
jgi:hypothetical protein